MQQDVPEVAPQEAANESPPAPRASPSANPSASPTVEPSVSPTRPTAPTVEPSPSPVRAPDAAADAGPAPTPGPPASGADGSPSDDAAALAPSVPGGWLGPGEWSSKGDLGLDGRLFWEDEDLDPIVADLTADRGLGLVGHLELRHEHGALQEKARVFGRLDHFDQKRSTFIVEELFLQAQGERLRLRVGADVLNWTATEAFHPADVINARNWDSDLENFEKLGEPMVSLQARLLEGTTLTVFFMPVRMENRASSPGSRLHFGLPGFPLPDRVMVDGKGDVTTSAFGPQAAIYLRQVIGSGDLGLHVLEHMDRSQPWIVGPQPALLFQTVRQVGATYQHVIGPLIVKLESVYRSFVALRNPEANAFSAPPNRDHGAVALGLEYGIGHEGGSESTLLLEGQAVLGVEDADVLQRLTPFQKDILAGYRFARNDEAGREAMIGVIVDVDQAKGIFRSGDGGEYVAIASYQQRLGETWTVKAGLRLFQARTPTDPFSARGLQPIRHADHVRLSLIRHF